MYLEESLGRLFCHGDGDGDDDGEESSLGARTKQ